MINDIEGRAPTIVVGFLEVHVDNTSAENRGHLVTVDFLDLSELSWLNLIATVLGEEDWYVEALEVFDDFVITRSSVRGVTAPGVDVVAPEVNGLFLPVTVKVGSHIIADFGVVIGSIADTHWAIVLLLDVGLHITDSSLNESTGIGVGAVVGNLVTGKETDDIGVLGQLVYDGGVAFVQGNVPLGVITDDGFFGLRKISHDVDAGILEHLHALFVVFLGVDSVNTDGVGLQLLH